MWQKIKLNFEKKEPTIIIIKNSISTSLEKKSSHSSGKTYVFCLMLRSRSWILPRFSVYGELIYEETFCGDTIK